MEKVIVQVLSSKSLNDVKNLKLYGNEIDTFLKETLPENSIIRIGHFRNEKMAEFLKSLNYEVEVVEQNWRKLLQLNKDMIDTSDITIILQYNESPNMSLFYDHAVSKGKKVYRLKLNSKDGIK
jgi:hypothetical protein